MKNNFEKAFERLDTILKDLDENQVSLEDSLKLFEEADTLIQDCEKYLTSAEKKVEKLIREREKNTLELDSNGKPKTTSYSVEATNSLAANTEETLPF